MNEEAFDISAVIAILDGDDPEDNDLFNSKCLLVYRKGLKLRRLLRAFSTLEVEPKEVLAVEQGRGFLLSVKMRRIFQSFFGTS